MSAADKRPTGKTASRGAGASVRSVNYSTSPLLASKTPPWRSKFLVALVGLSFCGLLGRALYVQVIGTEFFQRQGEMRYARTLDLPASRGRILDRNGLILASSIPAPSLWAIPKDFDADPAQRRSLAKLLGTTPAALADRLDDNPNFVWLRRQADDAVAKAVLALGLKGVHQVREYKRKYPEGEAATHVVGFTNVEDRGQEGIELAHEQDLLGRTGTRRATARVLVTVIDPALMNEYLAITFELRRAGVPTELYLGSERGLGRQMKYADRSGIPLALIYGSDEKAKGTVTLKDLEAGAAGAAQLSKNRDQWRQLRPGQFEVARADLVRAVRDFAAD